MAQPITCDGCQGELAVLMVTNIGNGDTFAVGADCLPGWHIASAQELLNVTLAPQAAPTPDPTGEQPSPPKSKRGKAKRADTGDDTPPDEQPVGDPEQDATAT